jgi:ATP-dependent Lhr-like helicase
MVLPWPAHPARQRPVRRAGALVVIGAGQLRMYLAQGGRNLLTFFEGDDPAHAAMVTSAAQALAIALRRGKRLSFTLDLINDEVIGRGPITDALRAAGFRNAPRGLSWEG